jgi:hypothetical protein
MSAVTPLTDWWHVRHMTPRANPAAVTGGRVLVLLAAPGTGWVQGLGDHAGWRPAFPLPSVGSAFEAPGGELVPWDGRGMGPVAHFESGVVGYSWGVTNSEPAARPDFDRWRLDYHLYGGHWILLDVAARASDYELFPGRTIGRARCKRGSVAYKGDLEGAVDFMRARWPGDAGAPPAWEDDPIVFPPPPPPPKPTEWVYDGNNGRLVRIETVRAKYG